MKILYFEPNSGASGDMILGALTELGIDFEKLKITLEKKIDVIIKKYKKIKSGIVATKIDVIENNIKKINSLKFDDLIHIIKKLELNNIVEEWALDIFNILGNAESKVHNLPLNELHIHEIGQKDAIVDIVGSCIALKDIIDRYDLSFENIISGPINTGFGTINCNHGNYTIPTPATLEILKNNNLFTFSSKNTENFELLTPTGAAILSFFTKYSKINIEIFKKIPKKLISFGYGSGNYDLSSSNVLRVSIYDIEDNSLVSNNENKEELEILETNIDNCTGEIMGSLIHKLIEKGAKDAFFIPIFMKKNRPGYLLSLIVNSSKSKELAYYIMKNTGTLGVRVIKTKHRYTAKRYIKNIIYKQDNKCYSIPVKISYIDNSTIINMSPEFDICNEISIRHNCSIKKLLEDIQFKILQTFEYN